MHCPGSNNDCNYYIQYHTSRLSGRMKMSVNSADVKVWRTTPVSVAKRSAHTNLIDRHCLGKAGRCVHGQFDPYIPRHKLPAHDAAKPRDITSTPASRRQTLTIAWTEQPHAISILHAISVLLCMLGLSKPPSG